MKRSLIFMLILLPVILWANVYTYNINVPDINNIGTMHTYLNEKGYPMLPILFYEYNLPLSNIDSVKVYNSKDFIKEDYPIRISTGPYTPSMGKIDVERKDVKGEYPQGLLKGYSYRKEGSRTKLSLYIMPYHYINGEVVRYDNIELKVFYTPQNADERKSDKKMYLVITTDSLVNYFDKFSDFYSSKGFDVNVRGVNEILSLYPSDTVIYAIRKYLQACYSDSNLYALLIGADVDLVPGIYIYIPVTPQIAGNDTIVTDRFYQCLDGDWDGDGDGIIGEIEDSVDMIPDILYGRVPFGDFSDIYGFTDKVERYYYAVYDTVLMVGNLLDSETDGGVGQDRVYYNANMVGNPSKLYESYGNLSPSSFINGMNNSPYIVMHDGHGNYSAIQSGTGYLYSSNVDTLHSSGFFMYSVACLSAGYDTDCIAEHFALNPYAGFYIGHSRYGWYCPAFAGYGPGEIAETFFFRNLMNDPIVGESFNKTLVNILPLIEGNNDYRWTYMVLTYMGDPLLSVKMPKNKNYTVNFIADPSYISGTIMPNDSGFVVSNNFGNEIITNYDNLFVLPYDTVLYIYRNGEVDTISVESPSLRSFIENYYYYGSKETGDTIVLKMKIFVNDSIDISFASNSELQPLSSAEKIYFNGDTTLEYLFEVLSVDTNMTFDIVLDNDTFNLLCGDMPNERITGDIEFNSSYYSIGDSAKFSFVFHSSWFDSLYVSLYANDSLMWHGYVYDTLFEESLVCSLNADSVIYSMIVKPDSLSEYVKILKLYSLSSGMVDEGDNISLWSADSFWYVDSVNYPQTYHCGTDSTYQSDFIGRLISRSYVYDSTVAGGFMHFYDVEAGWDFCVVQIIKGEDTLSYRTYDGHCTNWQYQSLNFRDMPINQGDTFKLAFNLFSDADSYQFTGWYIDNIAFPGLTNLSYVEDTVRDRIDMEPEIKYANNRIYVLTDKSVNWSIYDIMGRRINKGESKTIYLNMPRGVYFLQIDCGDIVWKKLLIR